MKSAEIKAITEALALAQIAFLPIKKTDQVDYQTTAGRKKYAYAPLDEVIEATKKGLSDNQLAVTQTTYLQGGGVILETLLCHSSGEWLSGELYVGKQDAPPQSLGSSLTYMRRYGMSAILGVASEADDDASRENKAPKEKPIAKKQPTSSTLDDATFTGIAEEDSDNLPNTEESSIDLTWLKEQLDILQSRGLKTWSNSNVLSYLRRITGGKETSVSQAVKALGKEEAADFTKRVRETIELS